MGVIPYARQSIDDADVEAVLTVLRSDWLTQGPTVARFEEEVVAYCGGGYAVAANSGTAALHLAYRALGLGPGDLLWTSPNTFVATANCARFCGADVDFVDIDPRTYNMSVDALEGKLADADRRRRLPRVIVPVHFGGQPCEMEAIAALGRRYGCLIVEDASHALGATCGGHRVGTCEYSDITVFSFHPVKLITTGEGGMVVTGRKELSDTARLLRSHGTTRDPERMDGPSDGPWYYQQIDLGYNYRLTDIQAALGITQMRRLEAFVARRRALAARYDELLRGLPLTTPVFDARQASAWHLYVVRLLLDQIRHTRRRVFESMREQGIQVNVHYIPVHTQPYYRAFGFRSGDFPEAERYYVEALSLPMYPALRSEDQDRVLDALRRALG